MWQWYIDLGHVKIWSSNMNPIRELKGKKLQMTLLGFLNEKKKNLTIAFQKVNRIFLKYNKSSAPTKSILVMFTEAWQYHVKKHKMSPIEMI